MSDPLGRKRSARAAPYAGMAEPEELRELLVTQHEQFAMLRRNVSDLNLLLDALRALLDSGDDIDPFTRVFEVLQPIFQFSHALVLVEDDAAGPLRCLVANDPLLNNHAWPRNRRVEAVLRGRVVATVAPVENAPMHTAAAERGMDVKQPTLYLPLKFREQRGLLMCCRPVGVDGFDRRDVAVARRLSLLASQALATREANRAEVERRRLDELAGELRTSRDRFAQRAHQDELTKLANRRFLEKRAREAIERAGAGDELGVAFIDLDGFKQVNDRYGHGVGDHLLLAVADRLRSHADQGDVIARMGADEFIVLIDPLGPLDDLIAALDGALGELREPFLVGRHRLMITASVGLALYPRHGTTYDELRRNADIAMYQSKRGGRGTITVFSEELGAAVSDRIDSEQQLRHAVAQRRFVAAFQPKVDLQSMEIVGFEVLARQIADDGTVGTSAAFIEMATDLGLLDQVTDIVVEDALSHLSELDEVFGAKTAISINLSTAQATDNHIMAMFLRRLADSGHSGRFIVEVTEDALLQQDAFQRTIMPMLAAAGARVSVDDFGSGYATLSRLLTMTADEIKIDRAFVTDIHQRPRTQVILEAMDRIGREFGASVVAEGIETEEELRYLQDHSGVHVGQGYLFARPALPADLVAGCDDLTQRLEQWSRREIPLFSS